MPNYTAKKSDAITALVLIAPEALKIAAQVAEVVANITDNGFLTGGSNPIIDADCTGENAHLDAATFNAAVAAIATLALSTGNRTTLRKTARKVLPF